MRLGFDFSECSPTNTTELLNISLMFRLASTHQRNEGVEKERKKKRMQRKNFYPRYSLVPIQRASAYLVKADSTNSVIVLSSKRKSKLFVGLFSFICCDLQIWK